MRSPARHPYYIYAPDFRDASAGVTALHLLCDALNSAGETAYLLARRSKPGLNVRFLSKINYWRHKLARAVPIVVYPEVVEDNPVKGCAIVRLMLNRDSLLTGRRIERQGPELTFYHLREFAPASSASPEIMTVPVLDDSLFSPPEAGAPRTRSYLYLGRVDRRIVDLGRLPPDTEILDIEHSRTLPELAALFRSASVLYSYEASGTCVCAMLAGCPVIYLRHPGLTDLPGREQYATDGAAFIDEPGGLQRAQETVAKVRRHWQKSKDEFPAQLRNFIDKTQAFADAMSAPGRGGGIDEDALVPTSQLEHGTQARAWRSTGNDPYFLARLALSPGLLHLELQMTSDSRSMVELYLDTGQGFVPSGRVVVREIQDRIDIERYLQLEKPARALQFHPLGAPGSFELLTFRLRPVSRMQMYLRAIRLACRQILAIGNIRGSIREALRLLLRGDLRTFRDVLLSMIGGRAVERAREYERWRAKRALTPADRKRMREEIAGLGAPPRFSVLMPVYNVPERYLRLAIESVLRQIYPHWELCIADDCSTAAHVRPVLEEYAARDARIKVVFRPRNGHISAASNSALQLATGKFLVLLDNDDELTENALHAMALAIAADPAVDMLYSDEDKINPGGRHVDPVFKPDWSPEYFLAGMYTCHLGVYRTQLVRDIGGFRSEFDGAQDYDLVLRIVTRTTRIRHVPDVLYHWRMLPSSAASGPGAKPTASDAARRALLDFQRATGDAGGVEAGPSEGYHRVRYALRGRPSVSVIIASGDETPGEDRSGARLVQCIQGIRGSSRYDAYEIVVAFSGDMPKDLESDLASLGASGRSFSASANLSARLNAVAGQRNGEHCLFLDENIEVRSADWIECLLEFSQQASVGAVGAKIYLPDGSLQHVGLVVEDGVVGQPYYGHDGTQRGYNGHNLVNRNCSAVSGACMMTRRELFHAVGGFDELFAAVYYDADYCLRLIGEGKRIVFTPYAELVLHPHASARERDQAASAAFRRRWSGRYPWDPYVSPSLTLADGDFRIRSD